MNTDIIQGKWEEIKGQVKAKWGKLTDDELTEISGEKQKLCGKLQKNYGYKKDQAEREVDNFLTGLR